VRLRWLSTDEKKKRRSTPHRWFAWFPVRVDETTKVWLAFVMRRDVAPLVYQCTWAYKQVE